MHPLLPFVFLTLVDRPSCFPLEPVCVWGKVEQQQHENMLVQGTFEIKE
jgi:hypothetical protein